MKVVIMPNLTREHAYETMNNLCMMLDKINIEYYFLSETVSDISVPDEKVVSQNELKDIDILIAIGGDGTMIRSAQVALPLNIPILGINAGRLAYLVGLESDELHLLKNLLTGDYHTEERLVLQIDVFDNDSNHIYSDFCINEVVFARGAEIRLTSLDFYCDKSFINRYNADGLIIATPTGSTAYNLAAGGPVVDPRIESIILSPICPHSLVERTAIFSSDSAFEVINPDNSSHTLLSCDGRSSIHFGYKYKACIKKSDMKVKFIRLKDDTFMETLHKKMKTIR